MNIKIIDNFLDQKDLNDLCSLNLENVQKDKVKVYHNSVYKNGDLKNECIDKEIL